MKKSQREMLRLAIERAPAAKLKRALTTLVDHEAKAQVAATDHPGDDLVGAEADGVETACEAVWSVLLGRPVLAREDEEA